MLRSCRRLEECGQKPEARTCSGRCAGSLSRSPQNLPRRGSTLLKRTGSWEGLGGVEEAHQALGDYRFGLMGDFSAGYDGPRPSASSVTGKRV